MRKLHQLTLSRACLLAIVSLAVTNCAEFNDPYYRPSGSYDPYPSYGSRYDDDYYRRREYDRQQDKIDREKERLREERRRLEEERERQREAERYRPPPPPPPRPESCPPGFSPSERKCSSEERKHGCRDIRLPGGLGCVSR